WTEGDHGDRIKVQGVWDAEEEARNVVSEAENLHRGGLGATGWAWRGSGFGRYDDFRGLSLLQPFVKNSTRPLATATGFLPGRSWLAHGIDTVSISGIRCCSRSATSKNTGNVSLPRIDSTGCRISFRPSVVIFQRCMAPSST